MRLSVLIAAVAVLFPAMDMQAQTASGKKVLVAYFSHSGNTCEMARQIAEATNGDLFEIVPQSAYPAQYDAVTAQAKREIGRGYRPALKGRLPDIGAYDVVFVARPVGGAPSRRPWRRSLPRTTGRERPLRRS